MTDKSSSKARKSVGGRKKPLYPSKYVDSILKKVSKEKLKSVSAHSTTISKWVEKMRLSILKKVSLSSKTLFMKGGTMDQLEAKIMSIKQKIEKKENELRDKLKIVDLKPLPKQDRYNVAEIDQMNSQMATTLRQSCESLYQLDHRLPLVKDTNELLSTAESLLRNNASKKDDNKSNTDVSSLPCQETDQMRIINDLLSTLDRD